MTTALMEREPTTPALPKEQVDLIRRTVANGATNDELALFLYDCQRRGIHPLDKLLHFTKRGGRYTPVTSIDFMRSQAAMTGEMAGSDDPEFLEGDGHPVAARVTVYRITQGQRFAYAATARWDEYCQDNAPMWKRMPHTMLGKCAEALALRKAFPQQLAGLYAREEMDQAEERPAATAPRLKAEREVLVAGNEHEKDGDPVHADAVIDTESGEVLPQRPLGYHYLTGYSINGQWHEATLLEWDAQGGSLKISTKYQNVGNQMLKASNDGIPVKADVTMKKNGKGEAYVNKLELYKAAAPVASEALSEPLADSDIPF